MSRPSGKSKLTSYDYRYFESTIKCDDHYLIYQKVKEWFSLNSSIIYEPILTKVDILDIILDDHNHHNHHKEIKYKSCINIRGHIIDNKVNDFDVFEELYNFFEFLFLELKVKEISFIFRDSEEIKFHQISNVIKKNKIDS